MRPNALSQLLWANLRMLYRDGSAFFWNLAIPLIIYSAVALFSPKIKITALNYGDFLLPGIAAYVVMQGGIYSLAYWLVDLQSQGVIKRFLVTPLKISDLVFSVVVSRLLVMLLQVAVITLTGKLFFHAAFAGNFFSVIILIVLGGGIFLLLGLLISAAAGSYQAASPFTAAVGLPLTALGNIFIPLDLFPPLLKTIGNFLPITHLANGLRQAYLYPFNTAIITDMLALLAWLVALLLITLSVFRLKGR